MDLILLFLNDRRLGIPFSESDLFFLTFYFRSHVERKMEPLDSSLPKNANNATIAKRHRLSFGVNDDNNNDHNDDDNDDNTTTTSKNSSDKNHNNGTTNNNDTNGIDNNIYNTNGRQQ